MGEQVVKELLNAKGKLLRRQARNLEYLIADVRENRLPDLPAHLDLSGLIRRWRDNMAMELRVRQFLELRNVPTSMQISPDITALVERQMAREKYQAGDSRSRVDEAGSGGCSPRASAPGPIRSRRMPVLRCA